MRSKARAAAFTGGALVCAGLSAAIAGTAQPPSGGDLGALREVVVTSTPLEDGAAIGAKVAERSLEVRRVPESFVPPDALALPQEAYGRKLAVPLAAGSYLTVSALKATRSGSALGALPRGTTPVEIAVMGAGALAAARADPGDRVDVVVSGDSAPGPATARTYVAASGVALLSLREEPEEAGGLATGRWIATLALTRPQALRLIRAESAGAGVRLLAG